MCDGDGLRISDGQKYPVRQNLVPGRRGPRAAGDKRYTCGASSRHSGLDRRRILGFDLQTPSCCCPCSAGRLAALAPRPLAREYAAGDNAGHSQRTRKSLRRGDRYAGPAQERVDYWARARNALWTQLAQRTRAARDLL
jgi:hypothetical protein